MNRFFAHKENIDGRSIRLDESETRHLRDVLRHRVGDAVRVFDGEGNEYEAIIEQLKKTQAFLSDIKVVRPASQESPLDLTVCAAILKGEKSDFAVQKAVELGVNSFVPLITARCDVKPKDVEKRLNRWRKIVLEASKQCGRARLMAVDEITSFDLAIAVENDSTKMMFTERDGNKFSIAVEPRAITAYFGPEGGWDDSELEAARRGAVNLVTLGGRIMKADTAVLAISAILQNHLGDIN